MTLARCVFCGVLGAMAFGALRYCGVPIWASLVVAMFVGLWAANDEEEFIDLGEQ